MSKKMKNRVGCLLTENQVVALIRALAEGQKTFTDMDVENVLDWADRHMIERALMNNAIAGHLGLCCRGKEVSWVRKAQHE